MPEKCFLCHKETEVTEMTLSKINLFKNLFFVLLLAVFCFLTTKYCGLSMVETLVVFVPLSMLTGLVTVLKWRIIC